MYGAYASANKDQMKIWKSARKELKDGAPEPPTTKVMLRVRTNDQGMIATLVATNSYQLMRRNITVEEGFTEGGEEVQIAIPGEAIRSAEKLMPKKGGRALFYDQKIEVHEVLLQEDTLEEIDRLIGTIPFLVQEELFKDWDGVLEREGNEDEQLPEKVLTFDASVFKPIVEQLRHGDNSVFVSIRIRGKNEAMLLTAFDDIEDMAIKAAVTPVRAD